MFQNSKVKSHPVAKMVQLWNALPAEQQQGVILEWFVKNLKEQIILKYQANQCTTKNCIACMT